MGAPLTGVNARIGLGTSLDPAANPPTYNPEQPLSDCSAWQLTLTAEQAQYRTCSTEGGKRSVYGGNEGTGSMSFLIDPDNPAYAELREGRSVLLYLYESDTHIDAGAPSRFWEVEAFITQVDVNPDIDGGGLIPLSVSFSVNGRAIDPDGGLPGPSA